MGVALAGAALAVAAGSAYMQNEQGQKAAGASRRQADAQREQAQLEQKKSDIANLRSVRTQLRQSRIQKASILNSGANAGTSTSSGVQGGVGSVESQSNANVNYFNEMGGLNDQVLETQMSQGQAAADMGAAQGKSATWGAIGGLGNSVFGAAGGFKTIFGEGKK